MIAGYLGLDVLNAARRWAYARAKLRRILDSKAASPQQVQKAKTDYNKLSNELEVMVSRLEKMLIQEGNHVPPVKRVPRPNGVPWQQVIGHLAKAAEVAITGPQQPQVEPPQDEYIEAEVIDTKGEPK